MTATKTAKRREALQVKTFNVNGTVYVRSEFAYATRVCADCYRAAPTVKPGRGFMCKCRLEGQRKKRRHSEPRNPVVATQPEPRWTT